MGKNIVGLVLLSASISFRAVAQSTGPEDTARVIHQSWLGNSHLRESSGLAGSRRQPGVLWTVNDSGNPPELFAIDSSGRDRGVFRIEGAENRDWEALALTRCGRSDCLYIAEVGDNNSRYDSLKLYRVPEPARPTTAGGTVVPNGIIELRYQDGPRDAEAVLVTPDQEVYIISKERSGGGRVYFLDRTAWDRPGVVTAKFLQELPLPEGSRFQITDASLGLDGIEVAIRTYSYIFFFRLENGRLLPDQERNRCYAGGLDAQGEGITWLKDGRLATTSERVAAGLGGTISIVECR
jgi:hypothetical protein